MLEIFRTFGSYCLIHFTTSMNWRYQACNSCISDIFTESDEAWCILLIENNADDYAKMYWEQRKIGRKEARPKYTKVECVEKSSRDGTEEVSRAIKKSKYSTQVRKRKWNSRQVMLSCQVRESKQKTASCKKTWTL